MIGQEQNDGVIHLQGAFEHIDDVADLVINIGNIGEIGAARPADIVIGNVKGGMVARRHQAF